jgi:hypothetical protein
MRVLGRYVLDTLQIFFPWDDDLYTYFKEHGLGASGLGSKKLPLVYTDNCESTEGIPERKRNNVIHPRFFGMTNQELGWKDTGRETQPIIPAEKPEMEVVLQESTGPPLIQLNIIPSTRGVEQYHSDKLGAFQDESIQTVFSEETKQAQREKFQYLTAGTLRYQFAYAGFSYAKRYFEANGFHDHLPSLSYDSSDPISRQLMDPVLKLGIIETKTTEGFEKRKAQVAMKLSQTKFMVTKRGVRGRVKGRIIVNDDPSSYFILDAADFATKIAKTCAGYSEETKAN